MSKALSLELRARVLAAVASGLGHWPTAIFFGVLAPGGMIAPFVLNGPINRGAFEAYVEQVLAPEVQSGGIVIMDNLFSHRNTHPRPDRTGRRIAYFTAGRHPNFNPIDNSFTKLWAVLRKSAE
jgi:transposase